MLYDPFSWTPSSLLELPTATSDTFGSINPTHTVGLISTLNAAFEQLATETHPVSFYFLSEKNRGAEASLTIIANQMFLLSAYASQTASTLTSQTTTLTTSSGYDSTTLEASVPTVAEDVLSDIAETNIADAQKAIFIARMNLKDLSWEQNIYQMFINKGANIFLLVCFILCFCGYVLYMFPLKFWYFSGAFILGCFLELMGYIGRILSVGNYSDVNSFLLQFVSLSLGPTFLAAGIYYLIGYLSLVYGAHLSPLHPTWYTYIFISCDCLSLILQALGGGIAATSLREHNDSDKGSHIMVAGIGFQVFSMSLFILLYMRFLYKVHFSLPDLPYPFTIKNFWTLVIRNKKINELDHLWEPSTSKIRRGRWFHYNQYAILASIMFLYIRCIYRVIELAQGWTGYLITREEYILTLDGMMILLAVIPFLILHPYLLFGKLLLSMFRFRQKNKKCPEEEPNLKIQNSDAQSVLDNTYLEERVSSISGEAGVLVISP